MDGRIPLVLIPGMLCNRTLWAHQLSALRDIAVMTVADTLHDDTVEAMAARVLHDAPERFAVAGLSMGGYVAQAIMRTAPERISHLALVDTSARADDAQQRRQRTALIRQVREAAPEKFIGATRRLLPLMIHPDRMNDETLVAEVTNMTRSVGRDVYIRQQTANLTRPDGRAGLRRIDCPTIIICGRQDALTPPGVHQEMHDAIGTSVMHVIEQCGHLAPMERPVRVSVLLRNWLEDGT